MKNNMEPIRSRSEMYEYVRLLRDLSGLETDVADDACLDIMLLLTHYIRGRMLDRERERAERSWTNPTPADPLAPLREQLGNERKQQ